MQVNLSQKQLKVKTNADKKEEFFIFALAFCLIKGYIIRAHKRRDG